MAHGLATRSSFQGVRLSSGLRAVPPVLFSCCTDHQEAEGSPRGNWSADCEVVRHMFEGSAIRFVSRTRRVHQRDVEGVSDLLTSVAEDFAPSLTASRRSQWPRWASEGSQPELLFEDLWRRHWPSSDVEKACAPFQFALSSRAGTDCGTCSASSHR